MKKNILSIDGLSDLHGYIYKAFITSVIINAFTFLLLLFLALMYYGGIQSFSKFHYLHFAMLFFGVLLSYGIYKENSLSFLLLFILFAADKILLISYGLINPVIGLFVFIFISYFLLRGFKASLVWNKSSIEEREEFLSKRQSFFERNKDLVNSFIIIAVFCVSGVVISNIFVLLEKSGVIEFTFLKYPLGVSLTVLLSIIGVYPLLKKLLGSFHQAFALIIFLALATSLSTLIPQSSTVPFQPEAYYIKAYGYLGHVFIFLNLHILFHSFWYISLFVLLIANIIKVMQKRKFSLKKIGFYITHSSLIFILLAVWYNFFFAYTGIIPLQEGSKSNRVFLFNESKRKLKVDEKKIDFYIKLDKFETKNWESAYNIYVKKFKQPIPKTLSEKTYSSFIKNVPMQFKGILRQAYKKEKKLSLSPSISILSTVGFTFLSSYREGGSQYMLQDVALKERKRILKRIFLIFGYKGKDIIANPIKEGTEEKVYATNISYKVLRYFENYKVDYVPIPKEISSSVFENKLLSSITSSSTSSSFASIIKDAYEKKDNLYILKNIAKLNAERRDKLAYALSSADINILLNEIPKKQSALGFYYLNGEDIQEIWLIDGKNKESNVVTLGSGKQVKYFWDIKSNKAKAILNKNKTLILIAGKDRLIYTNINNKIKQSTLTFNSPFLFGKKSYVYFRHILPNYELFHPYNKKIANIPMHIDNNTFEDKLLKNISSEEDKSFIKNTVYLKSSSKLWLLNPIFHYDEDAREKILPIFKEANFQVEPINPYALVEVSYRKDETLEKKIVSLAPKGLNVFPVPKTNYTLTFASRRDFETKYWKSDLIVLEPDSNNPDKLNEVHKDQIKVNQYMYYNGYRFYQTDANKDDKSYSGIGVSIEPGLPLIYTGFITLCLGVIIMFYVNVNVKSKKE